MHLLPAARNALVLLTLLSGGVSTNAQQGGVQTSRAPSHTGDPVLAPDSCSPLVYPFLSKRFNEEGHVLLAVSVGPDGAVDDVVVKQSSGFRRLDAAALTFIVECKFVPRPEGIVKVVDVPINFSMGTPEP